MIHMSKFEPKNMSLQFSGDCSTDYILVRFSTLDDGTKYCADNQPEATVLTSAHEVSIMMVSSTGSSNQLSIDWVQVTEPE